jgi:hypothetical protein
MVNFSLIFYESAPKSSEDHYTQNQLFVIFLLCDEFAGYSRLTLLSVYNIDSSMHYLLPRVATEII